MGIQEKVREALNSIKEKVKSTSEKIQSKISHPDHNPEQTTLNEAPKRESTVSQKLKDFTNKENYKKYFSPEAKEAMKNKLKNAQATLKDKADEISKKIPSKKKDI